ncbi:MAG: DinB family protein [Actinomycetota bacterium]|nr:DinB family protein [Actinomycetota bacterium]
MDDRPEPSLVDGEREQLNGFLDFLRATVVMKSSGLSEQDAHRSVLASPLMTVAGLLAHLRWVEASWFDKVLGGREGPAPYDPELPDAEFEVAKDMTLDRLLAEYTEECARSRETVAGMALTDVVDLRGDQRVNVRWVLLHMIEETGRHAGHLDVIREFLDGSTGE